jgi:hypothetical protein
MKDLLSKLERIKSGMGSMAMDNWGDREEQVISEAITRLSGDLPEIRLAKDALEQILFLNSCEEEAMSSGRPPASAWRDAFEQCGEALSALKNSPTK